MDSRMMILQAVLGLPDHISVLFCFVFESMSENKVGCYPDREKLSVQEVI